MPANPRFFEVSKVNDSQTYGTVRAIRKSAGHKPTFHLNPSAKTFSSSSCVHSRPLYHHIQPIPEQQDYSYNCYHTVPSGSGPGFRQRPASGWIDQFQSKSNHNCDSFHQQQQHQQMRQSFTAFNLAQDGWVDMTSSTYNNNNDIKSNINSWPSIQSLSPQLSSEDDDEDDDFPPSPTEHTNKYPVEIEYHSSKKCSYQRQKTKSGYKVKQLSPLITHDMSPSDPSNVQHIKYYEKHLVRVCNCKQYKQMYKTLASGLTEETNGYEIHYSQKCKWKAYDDFKTGERVLIRLCKCYSTKLE